MARSEDRSYERQNTERYKNVQTVLKFLNHVKRGENLRCQKGLFRVCFRRVVENWTVAELSAKNMAMSRVIGNL